MKLFLAFGLVCISLYAQTSDISPRTLQGAAYLTTAAGGGGQSMWSGVTTDFASNVTQYAPYGGGGATSTTETVVSTKASGAATITNLHVNIAVAVGASATLTVTLRSAAADQALTCTTASGGTTCDDATHSTSVANLALLDWKLVSSGSVTAGTPNVKISYSVGGPTSATIQVNSPISGDGSSGTPISCTTCMIAVSPGGGISRTVGSQTFTTSELSGDVTTSASNATTLLAKYKTRGIPFSIGDPAASVALTSGSTTTDYITVPFACTINAYNLVIDTGTVTVKFWKIASGTAIPTSANSINTSGVGIATGTAIHQTVLTDFTTRAVSANDIIAMNVTAVGSAHYLQGVLECGQ